MTNEICGAQANPDAWNCILKPDHEEPWHLTVFGHVWHYVGGQPVVGYPPLPAATHPPNGMSAGSTPTRWQDIDPRDAATINLRERLDITAPLNENGERCPWPWEPQQLATAPMGQYRCSYCMAMCVAGVEHLDYTGDTFADGGPGRE